MKNALIVMLLLIICAGASRAFMTNFDLLNKRGCCSSHGGVCGCSGGSAQCCDGTLSPTCGCD